MKFALHEIERIIKATIAELDWREKEFFLAIIRQKLDNFEKEDSGDK